MIFADCEMRMASARLLAPSFAYPAAWLHGFQRRDQVYEEPRRVVVPFIER